MNKIDIKSVLIGLVLITNVLILFELKKPIPTTQDVKIVSLKPSVTFPIVNNKRFSLSDNDVIKVRIVKWGQNIPFLRLLKNVTLGRFQ